MPMSRLPIALQLYSIREDCARDLPGTLREVARMGYEGVEFAGYYGRTAGELRAMLDDLGLRCAGTHAQFPTILEDQLEQTVEFNRTLGNPFLIVPALPAERRASHQAWLDTARLFTETAERVRALAAVIGYHNHSIEFTALEGELPWDTFFSNTPQDVVMQVDIGNALHRPRPDRPPQGVLRHQRQSPHRGRGRGLAPGLPTVRGGRRDGMVHRGAGELRLPASGMRGALPEKLERHGPVASYA
jgi:sugar phosphate isomerase/epimerase